MQGILNNLGDALFSTKLDFLYGFLKNMTDSGTNQVVDLIKNKIGLDISNSSTLENLSEDQINEIRTCVFDNFSTITNIHLLNKQLDVDNTKDARSMYLATQEKNKDSKFLAYFPPIYGGAITFVGLAYIFFITFFTIPQDNQRYADTILGFIMGSLIAPVIGFYFGSSSNFSVVDRKRDSNGKPPPPVVNNFSCDTEPEEEKLPRE